MGKVGVEIPTCLCYNLYRKRGKDNMAKRTEKEYEALIQKHMRTLKCTREEAIDVIACDDEIDRGNTDLFALTPEQKKIVRNVTKADRNPAVKRTVKRERKVDEDKKHIFDFLRIPLEGASLNGKIENLTFKNESEISFMYNGNAYSVKITKHRNKAD